MSRKTYRVARAGGRPRSSERTHESTRKPYPKGTTHVSSNARTWHRVATPPRLVRYARDDAGQHYRVIYNPIKGKATDTWFKVTPEHIAHMGKVMRRVWS